MKTIHLVTLLFGSVLLFAAAGCNRTSSAAAAQTTASATSVSQPAAANPAAAKVARIVFVGKEHPCDCTRKALDAGWAALQKALGTPTKVPVEKLQVDTDGSKVDPYRNQKPIMALPAIYFLDGKGTVVELLQGEVTTDQIAGVLQAS
jgi:hypothetical protein